MSQPGPNEEAFRIKWIDDSREFWLAGYDDGVPRWSRSKSDAVFVDRDTADELKERFGLYVDDGNLRLLDRPPERETKRLKDIQGWDYWDHKT